MIKIRYCSVLILTLLTTITSAFAQLKKENITLNQAINQIDAAFQNDSIEEFNKNVPLKSVQDIYSSVLKQKFRKQSGTSRIIRTSKDSAYVLLSGTFLYGNSGDETNVSNKYTGIYKFERKDDSWKLKDRIDIDRLNQIKKHQLEVDICPGSRMKIKDVLTIDVQDSLGFATKLNHRAQLKALLLNGSKTEYTFSGGLLWVNAKQKKNQKLVIDYTIEVEKNEDNKNSSYFGEAFGHVRNQYYWHPFFSFSSPNDRADFSLRCTIPKQYHLATSLPQKESVKGDLRIIEAKSEIPTFGLSMYYDKDWEVVTFNKDQIDMVVYTTKDFLPGKKALYEEFSKNYDTLQKHFGKPLGNYFGIVQDRSASNGWKNRSNSIVVAGEKGSLFITDKPNPRATFGHEVAHGWTSPIGPATNFLTEGWATYAESLLLSSVYGDSIVTRFFNSQKQNYIQGHFDGQASLWEDYSNNGISYSKGAWLFYTIENQLGKEKFSVAMQNFIKSGDQSIQSLIKQVSKVAGSNMEPLIYSWLKSKEIPSLEIEQSANTLKILQRRDVFVFPLEIRLKMKDGTYLDKVVNMNSKEHLLSILEGEIDSYTIDPKSKVLISVISSDI